GPGNVLDHHAAGRTINAAQGIHEHHGDLPQRHELKTPQRQAIIARPWLSAARADRPAVGSRVDRHFDRRSSVAGPPRISINERLVMLDAIEDSLQLHPESALTTKQCDNSIVADRRS